MSGTRPSRKHRRRPAPRGPDAASKDAPEVRDVVADSRGPVVPAGLATRFPLLVLLAFDLLCAIAIARRPRKLVLPIAPVDLPTRSPGFAAVTPAGALFVSTDAGVGAATMLVRVPWSGVISTQRIGTDLALLEPVHGLDSFMPSGARWAWNGHALVLAAPTRSIGSDHVTVVSIDPARGAAEPHSIDGTRPSVGWAGNHFEVGYVTPAPPPGAGRVSWIADVGADRALTNARIVSHPGEALSPFAWPNGTRTTIEGANPDQIVFADGRVVPIPHAAGEHVRPFFVLRGDGGSDVRFERSRLVTGSYMAGDYTVRASDGETTVEGHLGSQLPRLEYTLERHGRRVRFETDREALMPSILAAVHDGVLHVFDAHGFHARFRESDLAPLDPTAPRIGELATTLGSLWFAAVIASLAMAHALAILIERSARGKKGALRYAKVAGLVVMFLSGAAAVSIWTAA